MVISCMPNFQNSSGSCDTTRRRAIASRSPVCECQSGGARRSCHLYEVATTQSGRCGLRQGKAHARLKPCRSIASQHKRLRPYKIWNRFEALWLPQPQSNVSTLCFAATGVRTAILDLQSSSAKVQGCLLCAALLRKSDRTTLSLAVSNTHQDSATLTSRRCAAALTCEWTAFVCKVA